MFLQVKQEPMKPTEPTWTRLVWAVYFFPITMALFAIIPGLNLLYSTHGGIAWVLLPFSFPISIFRIYQINRRASDEQRPRVLRFSMISVFLYVPLSYLVSFIGAYSIQNFLGAPVSPVFLWGLFTLPFGLFFSWGFFVS